MTTAHGTSSGSQSPETARWFAGWTAYRPVLNGVIGVLAVAGLAVVFSLNQQQAKGFEDGCSLGPLDASSSTFDCAAAASSAASTLLGVSNIVWGGLFYAAIVLLTAALALVPRWRGGVHRIRAAGIGVGVLYSGYLTMYQFAYLDALCAFCLFSATLVAGMAVVQSAALYTPPSRSV